MDESTWIFPYDEPVHNWRSVYVRGEPKGQPRPRAFSRGGRARMYDPGTAEAWKSQIAIEFRDSVDRPIDRPIVLTIDFYLPRPKRLMRKKDPQGPVLHTGKPDIDNLLKAVMDSLTQIGFWRDDTQVVEVMARKFYVAKNDFPGALISYRKIGGKEYADN